jgi:hypothetical protein
VNIFIPVPYPDLVLFWIYYWMSSRFIKYAGTGSNDGFLFAGTLAIIDPDARVIGFRKDSLLNF